MILIEGILSNGSDLILPARFTPDRRALLTETPDVDMPLVAGNHTVLVSLNGQQLPSEGDDSSSGVSQTSHSLRIPSGSSDMTIKSYELYHISMQCQT